MLRAKSGGPVGIVGLMVVAACYLTAAAYITLPRHSLRSFSGPPPLFAFAVNIGTGFFVAPTGEVITARHVVNACRRITVSGYRFKAQRATLVADDAVDDLALLRLDITPPATLTIADGAWGTSDKTIRAVLTREEFGGGSIIGYHSWAVASETDAVGLPTQIITLDREHWFRVTTGLFIQGESGSPVLYHSGEVAGVLFRINMDEWTKRTPDGLEGNTGIFTPGPIVKRLAFSAGVNLATKVPAQPARAVVHIFCFTTFPKN